MGTSLSIIYIHIVTTVYLIAHKHVSCTCHESNLQNLAVGLFTSHTRSTKLSSMTIQITSHLKIHRRNSRFCLIGLCVMMCSKKLKKVTPFKKKRCRQLTWNSQLYTMSQGNSHHCCFVIIHVPYMASNNKISFSLYEST